MGEPNNDLIKITPQDIADLPASPEFRLWAGSMQPKRLNDILAGLKKAGINDGLPYLSELVGKNTPTHKSIAKGDFTERKDNPLFSKLSELVGENTKNNGYLFMLGRLGHVIMSEILSRGLFKRPRRRKKIYQNQPGLFDKRALAMNPQRDLFNGPLQIINARKRTTIKYLNPRWIEAEWLLITSAINKQRIWPDWYLRSKKHVAELHRLLAPIFDLETIKPYREWIEKSVTETTELTLLSWAAAIIWCHKSDKKYLFSEVPILSPQKDGLSGGRLDAIELNSINGQPLTESQQKVLSALTNRRFQSISQLQNHLWAYFRGDLGFRIFDWKFSIGDGGPNKILLEKDIPLAEHLVQVLEYQAFSGLSCFLDLKDKGDPTSTKYWLPFSQGALVYFFPKTEPQMFQVSSDTKQIANLLSETGSKMQQAEVAAQVRETTNAVLRHVIGLLKGKKIASRPPSLFPLKRVPRPAVQFLRGLPQPEPKYLDPLKIISEAERGKLLLNVRRLMEKIDSGEVHTEQFDYRGGFVRCLNPKHQDRHPSMHVSITLGVFKCFTLGCDTLGRLIDIPSDIEEKIKIIREGYGAALINRAARNIRDFAVPHEHYRVMEAAQQILQAQFKNSAAERYVREKRCLDPELAFEYGAGFGNERFINELLDTGLSLTNLIHYGFVGWGAKIKPSRSLYPLLRRRGLADSELKKEIPDPENDKKTVTQIPFSFLADRVTFPLYLNGGITSFYGRAVFPCHKRFYHRKLSVKHTGVPHGGFNFNVVTAKTGSEIYMTEAAFEALCLISLGYRGAIGIIGVLNDLMLETMANSGKTIAIALNNDEPKLNKLGVMCAPGQDATIKIIDRLVRRNVPTYDFTAKFVEKNPQFGYGDFNDYWKTINRFKSA